VHVVQQENAIVETGEQLLHRLLVKLLPRAGGDTFESLKHTGLIAFSLQPANEPRACVCESFVIEIDRVLRCEHYTEAKCATLLQQRQQRQL